MFSAHILNNISSNSLIHTSGYVMSTRPWRVHSWPCSVLSCFTIAPFWCHQPAPACPTISPPCTTADVRLHAGRGKVTGPWCRPALPGAPTQAGAGWCRPTLPGAPTQAPWCTGWCRLARTIQEPVTQYRAREALGEAGCLGGLAGLLGVHWAPSPGPQTSHTAF